MTCQRYFSHVLVVWDRFDAYPDELYFLPLTYNGGGHTVDLIIGNNYKKSETHTSYILLALSCADSFKVIGLWV